MFPMKLRLSSKSKKLRRLPHIFANVLELPLPSNADVSVEETPHSYRFAAMANNINIGKGVGVRAHSIQILPGITKIVIKTMDGRDVVNGQIRLPLDLWRFRLPPSTLPEMATAVCSGGKLLVTVPKCTANR